MQQIMLMKINDALGLRKRKGHPRRCLDMSSQRVQRLLKGDAVAMKKWICE